MSRDPSIPRMPRRDGGPRALLVAAGVSLLLVAAVRLGAQDPVPAAASVVSTRHNLSVSGPGSVKSMIETEVCKFCHTPHTAVVAVPLWGHAVTDVAGYRTAPIRSGSGFVQSAPQPNGGSRLCLSCHDGTVALGDLGHPGHRSVPDLDRPLRPGESGYLGTDLSGSHPISFVVAEIPETADSTTVDVGLRPSVEIRANRDVPLDAEGRMQCTTCHDPHSDRYYLAGRVPHFWRRPSVKEVCFACHELR